MNCDEIKRIQGTLGGVVPTQLKENVAVYIGTVDYAYKVVRDGERFLIDSANPLLKQTERTIIRIDSVDRKTSCSLEDWIGKDMVLTLTTPYGYSIMTREVESVSIEGEGYKLELWN